MSLNSKTKAQSLDYTVEHLLYLMKRLRDPDTGCPWDIKQSYSSITNSTIEEAYEVVDTIENGDYNHLKEELGDLLFQVIFYSQLAKEDGLYTFDDVVSTLTEKLIRRHPHVFPLGTLESSTSDIKSNEVVQNEKAIKVSWEAIKQAERSNKGKTGLLDDVPRTLPAMTRGIKLQKRVSSVGFDWPDRQQAFDKLKEEVMELDELMDEQPMDKIEEELGDVMFSVVNVSRHFDLDPETTLRKANEKFKRRFEYVEKGIEGAGGCLQGADADTMNDWWLKAKEKGL